jgi:hypothetical protein
MKTNLIFFAFVIIAQVSYAQDKKYSSTDQRAQCVFGELGGNGLAFSVNYDIRFARKQNGFGARAGIGLVPSFIATAVTFPVALNYLLGKGPHYVEAGAGATIVSYSSGIFDFLGSKGFTGVIFVPSLGYRYQPLKRGFTGRVIISPLIGSGEFQLWGGLSAGYKF